MKRNNESDQMNEVEKEQRQARFRNDLRELLNRHCMENESNTPDYMLADYLIECLHALDATINKRASWFGRFDSPGETHNAIELKGGASAPFSD